MKDLGIGARTCIFVLSQVERHGVSPMANDNHIQALRDRHADLDRRIQAMQSQPGREYLDIKKLKFDKLRIKDELTRLSSH